MTAKHQEYYQIYMMLCLAELICQYAGTMPKPNEMRECLKIQILTEGQSFHATNWVLQRWWLLSGSPTRF